MTEEDLARFCVYQSSWISVVSRVGSSLSVSIGNWSSMGNAEGTFEMEGIDKMGSYKIVMFIRVPLWEIRSDRVSIYEEKKKSYNG